MKKNLFAVALLSLPLLAGCNIGNDTTETVSEEDSSSIFISSSTSIEFVKTMTITTPMDENELYVGEQIKLGVSFNFAVKDPVITWRSLDETKATIDSSGLVIAIAPGEVSIQATYEDLQDTIDLTILEEEYTEGLEFTRYDDVDEDGQAYSYYAISGYTGTSSEIIIPATHDGLEVSFIDDDVFNDNELITDVYIASNIVYIGYRVFQDCVNLENVTLKKGKLASIWPYAFNGCTALKEIFIPDTVNYIGTYCFNVCNNLTIFAEASGPKEQWLSGWNNVNRPVIYSYAGINFEENGYSFAVSEDENNNRYCSIYGYTGTETILDIPGTVIFDTQILPIRHLIYGFQGNEMLQEVKVGENIISLGIDLFSECSNLTKVTLPNSLEVIEDRVFYRTASLKEILIPSKVTSIGEYAFNGNKALTKVFIPNSVDYIGHNCFFNVPNSLVIYYEGSSEGVNWDETWNYHNVKVVYNASIDDYTNA